MSKNVTLVLSSGGARGLAHIGVIEKLLERGYEISSIVGCSIGAVIGGFYSAGKLDEYREWVVKLDRLDVFGLLDFTFSTQGFVKGEKIFKVLEEIMEDQQIEDLRIPYCAIATDIKAKEEAVFKTGSLYNAMKASVAIPTVIRPVNIDGTYYVDGAITNPVPINYAKRMKGELLVVSDVNGIFPYEKLVVDEKLEKKKKEDYNKKIQSFLSKWSKLLPGGESETKNKFGFFDLVNDSIDLMQDKMTSLLVEKYKPEMLVQVSRNAASTFEFYKAQELIDAGKHAADQAITKYEHQL
ncbi:patatin-like phospholipase family protein [Marinoscillum sp. MHG1-6]|uniref:patatin-like phospholipase family protein n=1 Tax=Marinoscillum sp. MHG1-6 TaxID=2959627 RepID=UPI00215774BF|nr:patatin-like phospholipase family protein [Marinoscillum sp. MHG1-6]